VPAVRNRLAGHSQARLDVLGFWMEASSRESFDCVCDVRQYLGESLAHRHACRAFGRCDGIRRRESALRTVWPAGVASELATEAGDHV